MATLQFHSTAFNKGETAPTQVQILANDLVVERNAALAAQEAAVAQQTQQQGCLLAANHSMGLVPPAWYVLALPNLWFDVTRNQELVLVELVHRTRSVDTHKLFIIYFPSDFLRLSVSFIIPVYRCFLGKQWQPHQFNKFRWWRSQRSCCQICWIDASCPG